MAASRPDRSARHAVLLRSAVAGLALGIVGVAGGSQVLYDSRGLLLGATALVTALLLSLLLGLWAGAPEAAAEELPLGERWVTAGVVTAVAGAFASFWSLYGGISAGVLARTAALLLLVAGPSYAVGMIFPVLLAWGERQEDEAEEAEGWGALGAVVVGGVGGVSAGVLAAGLFLIPRLGPGPLLLVVAILLLMPLAVPEPERPAPDERLLHRADTPFGRLRVTEVVYPGERQPERRLYLNDEQESGELVRSGAPTLAYIAAAESWLASTSPVGSRYLFLGGGAYTLPRRVVERDRRARVVVVELDPEVTRLAYRFFGLRREHGISSAHGDARAFLEQGGEEFDRIYVDVYGGREALPYAMVTREAFLAMRRRLRPGGAAGMNLIGVTVGPEAATAWSVVRTFREVFSAVALYCHLGPEYPERQNLLLVGSVEPAAPAPPRAGLFERWPQEEWPDAGNAVVFRDLYQATRGRQGTGNREQGTVARSRGPASE